MLALSERTITQEGLGNWRICFCCVFFFLFFLRPVSQHEMRRMEKESSLHSDTDNSAGRSFPSEQANCTLCKGIGWNGDQTRVSRRIVMIAGKKKCSKVVFSRETMEDQVTPHRLPLRTHHTSLSLTLQEFPAFPAQRKQVSGGTVRLI